MKDPVTSATAELSFGEALAELDQIVSALEGGQLELEDSLTRYERGVSLLRALQSKLAEAQLKVNELIGELESEDEPDASAKPAASSEGVSEEVPF